MEQKIFLIVLTILLVQVGSLSLSRHDGYSSSCFYYPLGDVQKDIDFKYNIRVPWALKQAEQIKSGALSASSFIDASGWASYASPSIFF